MNGLTVNAPWWQTGFTTLNTVIPPRQRGFVVYAFPSSRLSPLRRCLPRIGGVGLEGELRRSPGSRESAPPLFTVVAARVATLSEWRAGVRFSQRMRQRP